jgi:polar amino acid transport system substrate-binding protein
MDNISWNRRAFMRQVAFTGAAVFGGSQLISACGSGESTSGDPGTLARGREQGKLRVGIANEPPFTQVTADGTVTGVEPDIARAVLKKIGIADIEGIVTPYGQMIPGMQAGRWDMVAAGLFMKKSRCSQVLYTDPTIVSTYSFGVKAGNPNGITSVADVKQTQFKIAAQGGAFEEGILKSAGIPTDRIVQVNDTRSGVEAVKSARADAVLLPTLSLDELFKNDKTMEATPAIKDAPVTGAGHAFRKNDTELFSAYNKALVELKRSGEFKEIVTKWGFRAEDALTVTTQQLCATDG